MLLRPKLTIAFLLTSVIPIILIGFSTYTYVKASMERSILDGINVIAELKEANLFLYLENLKTTTRDFSSDGLIRKNIEKINTSPDSKEKIARTVLNLHLIKNKSPLNTEILFIDVLNVDGIVSSSSIQKRVGVDKSKKQYFIQGKKDVYINDVHFHDDGILELEIAAPLFSQLDPTKLVGVLVNHFSISSIKDLFSGDIVLGYGAKSQSPGIGNTGETYLVNKDKLMMNNSIFNKGSSFKQEVDTYPVKMNIEYNKEVQGRWKNYRGVNVVGASMSIVIDDFKWTLISEQDVDEAFASVENLKQTYIIIIIIITVLVLLTAIIISKNITLPIGLLTRELERLGEGNENSLIKNIQSNDEIGYFARTFERMSTRLNKALNDIQQKNKQLEELSVRDGLTGLINHRHYKELMEMEFNRSYRYKTPLCCIMLDIDYFKSINDTYGHLFGDVVLHGVAAVIKQACRISDIKARYGGEEFIVLLPNTDMQQAQVVAEKLFEMIKSESYSDSKNQTSITVSIGISFFHEQLKTYSDMIDEADQAMYQAKNSGRNRICVFGEKETG